MGRMLAPFFFFFFFVMLLKAMVSPLTDRTQIHTFFEPEYESSSQRSAGQAIISEIRTWSSEKGRDLPWATPSVGTGEQPESGQRSSHCWSLEQPSG